MQDRFVVHDPFDGHAIGDILAHVTPEHRHRVHKLPDEQDAPDQDSAVEQPPERTLAAPERES